ncbi:hypothetical protein CHUAL_000119 [Chamberlinius hualienensis]
MASRCPKIDLYLSVPRKMRSLAVSMCFVVFVLSLAVSEARVNRQSLDEADNVGPEEIEKIRMKVEHMNDEELARLMSLVLPHQQQRYKRTIGSVRRCIDKVRCLFTSLKRSKRQTSAASILRAISKLTSIASDAANELLAGESEDNAASSSSSSNSEDSGSSSDLLDTLAEGSETVEDQKCNQRCNISVLMYRRLSRLLRNL